MSSLPARRLTPLTLVTALLTAGVALAPIVRTAGPGPSMHLSVRGEVVRLYGYGPYRHMPAEVAVQGLAQDLVTLLIGVPFLLLSLGWARRGSQAGHLMLTGAVAYLFVQYTMYLAMGTYNELFLGWVAQVLFTSQLLGRLLLARPASLFAVSNSSLVARRYVAGFLLINGAMIGMLWLGVIVPPLVRGTLYPAGIAHFTTMVVQGFDLALFVPPSLQAGYAYWRRLPPGDLVAPVYAVFVALQMTALLGKIVWMSWIGVNVGPAMIVIPTLFAGAISAAFVAIFPHRRIVWRWS